MVGNTDTAHSRGTLDTRAPNTQAEDNSSHMRADNTHTAPYTHSASSVVASQHPARAQPEPLWLPQASVGGIAPHGRSEIPTLRPSRNRAYTRRHLKRSR